MIKENAKKDFGLILEVTLNLLEHINEQIQKANKGIDIKKLNFSLPRSSLITIYKTFIRPHLDYGDIILRTPQ